MFATAAELNRIAEQMGPVDGTILKSAAAELAQRREGHPMFTKHQLEDLTEREKAFELHGVWMAAVDLENELNDTATDEDIEKARQGVMTAKAAYEELDSLELMEDYQGNAMRCSACGAPLYDDDETVVDNITDQVYLRIAIGLGPRAKQDEGQMLPDAVNP